MYKTFVDKRGLLNHLIPTDIEGKLFSYENIVKNSKKLNPWNQFFVKLYDSEGNDLLEYTEVNKTIFRNPRLVDITRKLNPEYLI